MQLPRASPWSSLVRRALSVSQISRSIADRAHVPQRRTDTSPRGANIDGEDKDWDFVRLSPCDSLELLADAHARSLRVRTGHGRGLLLERDQGALQGRVQHVRLRSLSALLSAARMPIDC